MFSRPSETLSDHQVVSPPPPPSIPDSGALFLRTRTSPSYAVFVHNRTVVVLIPLDPPTHTRLPLVMVICVPRPIRTVYLTISEPHKDIQLYLPACLLYHVPVVNMQSTFLTSPFFPVSSSHSGPRDNRDMSSTFVFSVGGSYFRVA